FHVQAKQRNGGTDPAEKLDYPAQLVEHLVSAIVEAHEKAQPATLTPGRSEVTGASFNRRFHMKDGTVRFNPGRKNPDIVRVAGPIDPDVSVLRFQNAEGNCLAMLTVFALHLDTVSGTLYSA